MRVVICANTAWNLHNFRAGLIRALIARGMEVVAVAPPDSKHGPMLESLGCRFVPLPMDSKGTSPLGDLRLLLGFLGIFRRLKPDCFLGYTIKPNIYGSFAARVLGICVINNVSGLGTAFVSESWLTRVARSLYRLALSRSKVVFFQNRDDLDLFVESGLVRSEQVRLLPGSGIDLQRFAPVAIGRREAEGPVFLLIARLLWDKGVGEYVEAARRVKARLPSARFQLLGFLDVENRSAVNRDAVEAWVAEGLVEYLGRTDDVRPFIAGADCVVLPSYYREGVPHSLLEAAAMARPIITTDWIGCREVVDDGVSGYLCAVRDPASLATAVLRFIELPLRERLAMGAAGRAKMEREFDEKFVIDAYLEAIIAGRHWSNSTDHTN